MSYADYALGDQYYGNDNNPLSGRYQDVKFSGWQAGQDVTSGTPDSTIFVLPTPPPFESIEVLDICVRYPAASGAVSTPVQLIPGKYAAGTNTPFVPLYEGFVSNDDAGMYVASEASIPINTVRKYSLATPVAATFQAAQVGTGNFVYPVINPGDILNMLLHVAGVGGTQSLEFGYLYRERPGAIVAPAMTSAGTNTTFG